MARACLDQLGDFGEYSLDTVDPDYWLYKQGIRRSPNISPGADAIPYGGWQAAGDRGVHSSMAIDCKLKSGGGPASDFNVARLIPNKCVVTLDCMII